MTDWTRVTVRGSLAAVAAPPAMPTPQTAAPPTLRAGSSRLGRVLFDGRGFVLYAFTRDARGGLSRCYGACAAAWPPYVLAGRRSVGAGLRRALLGPR